MRLTRRAFIQASCATAALLVAGCATQGATPGHQCDGRAQGTTRRPRQRRLGREHLPGLHAVVRDPDLRRGRPRRARARQSAFEDQPRLRLPARAPDPAAGLRSRPDQGADEADQPGKGARRRSEVRADHVGRGARHDRRQDDGAAQEQRGAQARVHARPVLADVDRTALRRIAEDLRDDQLLLAQRDLRGSREDGPGTDAGLLRLPRLRPRKDELPRDLGLRSIGLEPDGAQHDGALPRDRGARHRDHRGPATFQFRVQVAGVAADQARHRWRAGGRDRACPADRRPVEPRVRRQFQGRREPVRRRPHRRRGSLRRKGDVRSREVVEPRAQGPHAGMGREGDADPGGADRSRRPVRWARRRRRPPSGWAPAWR